MPNITYQLIDDFDTFLRLEKEWERLRLSTHNSELCVSWNWLRYWYESYWQSQNKLFIHAYYQQGTLVALLPCYLKKVALGYQLRFMATGDAENIEVCSEFQDFIIEKSCYLAVVSHFSQQIMQSKAIIALAFENVLPNALVSSWLNDFQAKGFYQRKTATGLRYCITVQPTVNAQISLFKSKTTRRHANKYLALSACSVEQLIDEKLFDEYYQTLIIEHNQLWKSRGKQGAFEQKEFVCFHKKLAKELLKQHKLVLFKLCYKKQCVAIFYGIIDHNTLYYYQSAVGKHDEIPSVGVAMHIEALNIAREKGLACYDLMKGQLTSYKNRYVIGEPEIWSIFVEKLRYRWSQNISKLKHKIIG